MRENARGLEDINQETWDAFAKTVLVIDLPQGKVAVEPAAETTGEFPVESTVHVITAYNPWGRTIRHDLNLQNHSELLERVRGWDCDRFDAVGRSPDGEHAEESIALAGADEEEVLELARHFGQAAIFRWSSQALEVVDQRGSVRSRRGWRLFRAYRFVLE